METATTTTTAVIVWNDAQAKAVRDFVTAGLSVPKSLMKAAPAGFVNGLRATRKAELIKETPVLLGGFQRDGFRIEALSAIKTLKTGVKQVTLKLATAKPTSALTLAEFAESMGVSVDEIQQTFGK